MREESIRKIFMFKGCNELVMRRYVFPNAIEKKYPSGSTVMCPQNASREEDKRIGFLVSGSCAVYTSDSGKPALVKFISPGGALGASNLFGDHPFVTRIVSVGESKIVFFTKKDFVEIIQNDSAVSLNYLEFLSDRICYLNKKIATVTGGSAERRVALYICSLAVGRSNDITLPVSLTSLANFLDIGRASLYRVLETLEGSGAIEHKLKHIKIKDREILKSFCEKNN